MAEPFEHLCSIDKIGGLHRQLLAQLRPARSYDLIPAREECHLTYSKVASEISGGLRVTDLVAAGRSGVVCVGSDVLIIHDESRAALPGQEQPGPLQEDADPKTELSQIQSVNESPRQPRQKTMYVHFAAF